MVDTVPGTNNRAVREVIDGREVFTPMVSSGGGGSSGGLTNAELRAAAVAVSMTGSATSALQTTGNANIGPATARSAVTDPAAAADVNQLLRGILAALNQIVINTTTP